jgi:hypothetical protein
MRQTLLSEEDAAIEQLQTSVKKIDASLTLLLLAMSSCNVPRHHVWGAE